MLDNHADPLRLDGVEVKAINADLTSSTNLIVSKRLKENADVAFLGTKKGGPFDINGDIARDMLLSPINPDGKSNAIVVRPRSTGADMVRRPLDKWIIDFGHDVSERNAALFERPFQYVLQHVKPIRDLNRRERRRQYWWLHSETAPGMRNSIAHCRE